MFSELDNVIRDLTHCQRNFGLTVGSRLYRGFSWRLVLRRSGFCCVEAPKMRFCGHEDTDFCIWAYRFVDIRGTIMRLIKVKSIATTFGLHPAATHLPFRKLLPQKEPRFLPFYKPTSILVLCSSLLSPTFGVFRLTDMFGQSHQTCLDRLIKHVSPGSCDALQLRGEDGTGRWIETVIESSQWDYGERRVEERT